MLYNVKEVFENHKLEYVVLFVAYAACDLSSFIRIFNYENNIMASANPINEYIRHNVRKMFV